MSENGCKHPVQGLERGLSEPDPQLLFHILQTGQRINDHRIVSLCPKLHFIFIIFVQDLTDDLFQDILHGYDPGGLSVLIDHDRHMQLFLLHGVEQVSDAMRLGNKSRFTDQSGKLLQGLEFRPRILGIEFQRILIMYDSDDIVNISPIDRIPGISFLQHLFHKLLQKDLFIKGDHILPMRHDISGLCVIKGHDVLDHLRFILFDDALFMRFIHQINDLFFGHRLFHLMESHTEGNRQDPGRPGDQNTRRE